MCQAGIFRARFHHLRQLGMVEREQDVGNCPLAQMLAAEVKLGRFGIGPNRFAIHFHAAVCAAKPAYTIPMDCWPAIGRFWKLKLRYELRAKEGIA